MIRLATVRLSLRWLDRRDAGLMLEIWNDPAFIRFVGDRGVRTLDQARDALEDGVLRLYQDYEYGPFCVVLRDGGTAIGVCGLFRRENLNEPDIGFALLPAYCGHGYAYEAAAAVIEHARGDLGLPSLTAIVSPDNRISISLIEKLGLHYDRDVRMNGDSEDIHLYRIDFDAGTGQVRDLLVSDGARTGLYFGATSGVITTIGLIAGLNAGTRSIAAVLGGILVIAVADALSDALGIHLAEEADPNTTTGHIWTATISTFLTKFVFALSFAVPVLLLPLGPAVVVSIAWGILVIAVLSFFIARSQQASPAGIIAEHVGIAVLVVVLSHFIGSWVGSAFG